MRLLLLFLLCYFAYRYGRYLFSQFQPAKPQAKTNTNYSGQHHSTNYKTTASSSAKKQQPEEGEYVDFEEIK